MRVLRFLCQPAVFVVSFCACFCAGQNLQGSFHLNKDTYTVGEPLFFTTEIKNTRNEPVYLWASKDGERLDLYQFQVQGPGGACGNRWDNTGSVEPRQLQPAETYHEQWPLDHFYRLGREGKYDVTISHKLRLSSATTGVQDFSFSSKFQLKLVAADSDAVQKTIQAFERDLNSDNPELEHAALDTMATTGPSYFLPQIMRIAHDKDPFRVLHAVAALRQMSVPEGWAVLADIITSRETRNQDEISVRFHAIQALGESGDLAYLPLVQRYTGDKIGDIQLESMVAVAQLGKEATTPELQRFSLSADPATRKNAVYALRFAMNSQAVEALIDALADKAPEVRSRAATSLQEMTGHSESLPSNNGIAPGETQDRWRKWWRENHEATHLIEPAEFVCRLN